MPSCEEGTCGHSHHNGVLPFIQEVEMKSVPGNPTEYDVYLAGSLRNEKVLTLTQHLMEAGLEVFSDWMAAGPEADDYWKKYYQSLDLTFIEALEEPASKHVFEFDKKHMLKSKCMVLLLPAGKSGHLELGWFMGYTRRPGFIMTDGDPDRWDVMYQFADAVTDSVDELVDLIKAVVR